MRECGSCTKCCETLEIPTLDSPAYSACRHMTAGGCGIYEERPESPCRTFSCAWLQGFFEEKDRPDKSGVIVWQVGSNGSRRTIISVISEVPIDHELVEYVCGMTDQVVVEAEGQPPYTFEVTQ